MGKMSVKGIMVIRKKEKKRAINGQWRDIDQEK